MSFMKKTSESLNQYITKEKNKINNESNLGNPLSFKIENVTKLYFPLCAPKVYAIHDVFFFFNNNSS